MRYPRPSQARKDYCKTSFMLSSWSMQQLRDVARKRGGSLSYNLGIAIDRLARDPEGPPGAELIGFIIRLLWADVLMPYQPETLLDIAHKDSAREYADLLKTAIEKATGVETSVQIDMTQPDHGTNYGLFAVLKDVNGATSTVRGEHVPFELEEPVRQAQAEMQARLLTGEWIVRKGEA